MTKYTHQTATGPVEIDVDPHWEAILKAEDAKEERNNRKHSRVDHKYAPCAPLSLESLYQEGAWFADKNDCIEKATFWIDLERAMETLTELQRRYFVMTRLEGYTCAEIARLECKDESTIRETVASAKKKIRTHFEQYPRY